MQSEKCQIAASISIDLAPQFVGIANDDHLHVVVQLAEQAHQGLDEQRLTFEEEDPHLRFSLSDGALATLELATEAG